MCKSNDYEILAMPTIMVAFSLLPAIWRYIDTFPLKLELIKCNKKETLYFNGEPYNFSLQ